MSEECAFNVGDVVRHRDGSGPETVVKVHSVKQGWSGWYLTTSFEREPLVRATRFAPAHEFVTCHPVAARLGRWRPHTVLVVAVAGGLWVLIWLAIGSLGASL